MIKYKINAFTPERFCVTIMWFYNDEWIVIFNHVINALILQLNVFLSQSCDAMMMN